jgi:hypothetical protein
MGKEQPTVRGRYARMGDLMMERGGWPYAPSQRFLSPQERTEGLIWELKQFAWMMGIDPLIARAVMGGKCFYTGLMICRRKCGAYEGENGKVLLALDWMIKEHVKQYFQGLGWTQPRN